MGSVVIAAHNEEFAITRCLDALAGAEGVDGLEVVVVANGCSDQTVHAATRPGVTVLDLPVAGKAAALNAGDAVATGFPRVYLDADMTLTGNDVGRLIAALDQRAVEADASAGVAPLAAVPRRVLVVAGRPWPVRAYYAVHSRLPVFERALFGRGVIVLSRTGRSRFTTFPEVLADDLFLDAQFTDDERVVVRDVTSRVETPHSTRDLLRRLVRVRRANRALRGAARGGSEISASAPRAASRWSWLRDVVVPHPWLAPAGVVYAVLTVVAELSARRAPASSDWGQDRSTRGPLTGTEGP